MTFRLRPQHKPGRMATLEAIAHGLGVIEGDGVKAQLMALYHARVERTLTSRGLCKPGDADCWRAIAGP